MEDPFDNRGFYWNYSLHLRLELCNFAEISKTVKVQVIAIQNLQLGEFSPDTFQEEISGLCAAKGENCHP